MLRIVKAFIINIWAIMFAIAATKTLVELCQSAN